ncbi:MAG: Mrp/NBP35 family ATP-binding protein [Bdellovibrionaceae bacterium]|nr:Mrp/NBP35 family ATP-binding protein [Pseudobdellovibrionaceae bacterium]
MTIANNPYELQRPIAGVKHVIAVGSGKGGVGKSTASAHIAIALKNLGLKVGVLDADIYGPSMPRIFGCLNQKPGISEDTDKILPLEKYGLKIMSMGFLVDEDQAVVWRGPMLFKAMSQFFRDVEWGDLDVLVVDLPPGTGDVALTLAQQVTVSGAFVVSTPQNLSLTDARKAFDMFAQIKIPVMGFIENMAGFKIPGTDDVIDLFPKGQSESFLNADVEKFKIQFQPQLAVACETGVPLNQLDPNSESTQAFQNIAEYLKTKLSL